MALPGADRGKDITDSDLKAVSGVGGGSEYGPAR